MFTGIIEATAKVLERTSGVLVLARPASFDDMKIGSSICVSGVCLSVVSFDQNQMQFDVVAETWSKTKLGSLNAGDQVNLERALRADGRFEGHVVQGHVEGVAEVIALTKDHPLLTIRLPQDLLRFIIPKGSITIDGVSLTIAGTGTDTCSVALIPHTLAHTTLGSLKTGDRVNIETDVFVRAVLHNQ